jgi:serine/threonine-protein kinase
MGALADRIGHAYGLEGSHLDWARTPQAELAASIRDNLPARLARHEAEQASAGDGGKAIDQAFKAGSEGGPSGIKDDLVMGVPTSGPPRWIYAAIAGAVILVALVVFVIAR